MVVADPGPRRRRGGRLRRGPPAAQRSAQQYQRQLDDIQQRFDNYQNEVVTHFNSTAALVKKLTQSYQDVQDHLADGANRLALMT